MGSFGTKAVTDDYAYDLSSGHFTDLPEFKDIPYEFQQMSVDGQSIRAESGSLGTPAKTKASGTIEFTYQWVPIVAGGKPSKDLNVLISGNTSASAASPFSNESHRPEGNASAWADGKPTSSNTQEQDEGIDPSAFTNGAKLFKISKNTLSSTATFSLGAEASTPGLVPPPGQDGRSAHRAVTRVSVNASTRFDNRSVGISRVGAHDEWTDGEGNKHGDSIYSAKRDVFLAGDYKNFLRYNTSLFGSWSTDVNGFNVTSTWDPQGFDQITGKDSTGAQGFANFGTPTLKQAGWHDYFATYYDGSPTGKKEFTSTYTVTDNIDGAVGEGKYYLTLHDPVEEAGKTTPTSYEITRFVTLPGGQKFFRGPNSDNAEERHQYSLTEHSEHGYGASATMGVEGFEDLLGLSIHGNVDISAEADVAVKITVPHLDKDEECYLMAVYPFQRKHVKFWKYDSGGKNKRFITDSSGAKTEVYQEAFQDIAGVGQPNFVKVKQGTIDYTEVPEKEAPKPKFDYPSGGSA